MMLIETTNARATLQISIPIFFVLENARSASKLPLPSLGRPYALSAPSLRYATSPRRPAHGFEQKMTTFEHTFTWSVSRPLSRPETFPLTTCDRSGLIPPLSKSSSVLSRPFFTFCAGTDEIIAAIRRRVLLTRCATLQTVFERTRAVY